jgi:hypothetical protein
MLVVNLLNRSKIQVFGNDIKKYKLHASRN